MKIFSKFIQSLSALTILSVLLLSPAHAAMNDYCITPPFIVAGVQPNLLLMIDNSASMYDLSYLDKGTTTREPTYCYDETYNFSVHYTGYFQDKEAPDPLHTPERPSRYVYYEYDFTNGYFYKTNYTHITFPAGCSKSIPGTLCVNIDTTASPHKVTKFAAEGNYLNWLSSSKFDIQKQILTGGKYLEISTVDGSDGVMGETRGCVGRRFIKEPITGLTFQEYTPPAADPNTGLGLTFAIKGPDHPYSDTLLSPGGQTYLEIYEGDYNAGLCDTAIDLIVSGGGKQAITDAIQACLNYSSKDTCSLDPNIPCKDDLDCDGDTGTGVCPAVVHDGVCGLNNDGNCDISTFGVCTANNGTCRKTKPRICVGGGKDGASCNNDADCLYSSCTVGRVGSICSVNADCNVQTCVAGLIGNACVVDSECNTGQCTAPPANAGNPCILPTDCDSGLSTCSSGQVGKVCTTNVECNTNYAGVCLKPVTQQIKSTFGQSMHECYQYWETGDFGGTNYLELITNPSGCSQIYLEYMTCNGGERDGKQCYTLGATADCPGGTCINGPEAIRQGSPALICSKKFTGYCAGSNDSWATTTWYQREYASPDDCITEKFKDFCTEAQVPPVTDPSDDPSTTENFDNLPAIIGDMSIGAQLGDPLQNNGCSDPDCALSVNLKLGAAPFGLIQEFESLIRFGALTFNFFGSLTECPANVLCSNVCSTSSDVSCMVNADCPTGETCVPAANTDGGHIINLEDASGNRGKEGYILGKCSSTTTTTCTNNAHCPDGEKCVFSVGDHTTGLIYALDSVRAMTWTPFAEGFYNAIGYFAQRVDTRLNGVDLDTSDFIVQTEDADYKAPVQYRCQKNNILLITDGMSTADLNSTVNNLVSTYNDGDGQINNAPAACPEFAGSRNLDDLAWLAKHRNIKDFTETPLDTDPAINSKTLTTYTVFNGTASTDPGECNPETLLTETADNGGGLYQRAENPEELKEALRKAFQMISGRAASGTAASVLATGEGSGANLVQAIFYPELTFANGICAKTKTIICINTNDCPLIDPAVPLGGREQCVKMVDWMGSMKNLWYYIDPRLGNSSIREDTVVDKTLTITQDNIVHFFFDETDNLTKARLLSDSDGDGVANLEVAGSPVYFENLNSLWEASGKLWTRDANDRDIFTYDINSKTVIPFEPARKGDLQTYLQAGSEPEAEAIIRYIRGEDTPFSPAIAGFDPTYRNRTVTISGDINTQKLGDIIDATPRIISWFPLNNYYKTYIDKSYKAFTETPEYTGRGLAVVGSNDGMLHAFRFGNLELFEEKEKKAYLGGTDLGREEWAFIPYNALPYLKHLADPAYCHLYYVDMTPYVFDASIGDCGLANYWDCPKYDTATGDPITARWKTILIGGMRQGGGCKDPTDTVAPIGVADSCKKDLNGDGVVNNNDCVLAPAADLGYSSYFALDVTNPLSPQVLWEFSDKALGFSTTGPAIVRISAKDAITGKPDKDKNGRWFVVLGSGPTGPIEKDTHQFKGYSDQPLRVFILDLATGDLLHTITSPVIANSFVGHMVGSPIDFDQNNPSSEEFYQDEALYFGYAMAENSPPLPTTKWNRGGVLRLVTKNSLYPDGSGGAPAWTMSKVIEGIGPVTAGVAKLQDYKTDIVRLYFGTGRYYFKVADNIDDAVSGRSLYSVREYCYSSSGFNDACVDDLARTDLGDANGGPSNDADGWYIDLDTCTNDAGAPVLCADATASYMAERSVTDPLATPIGAVFFTTTKPAYDVCTFGGRSHLWAVQFDTGGEVKSGVLRGHALLQVSTGSIEEVDLKTAFHGDPVNNPYSRDNRRTDAYQGVPPTGSPPGILIPPKPQDRILHIRER